MDLISAPVLLTIVMSGLYWAKTAKTTANKNTNESTGFFIKTPLYNEYFYPD